MGCRVQTRGKFHGLLTKSWEECKIKPPQMHTSDRSLHGCNEMRLGFENDSKGLGSKMGTSTNGVEIG